MKHLLDTALAAALLLCLAITGQAAAQPSPAADDPTETMAYEGEQEAPITGDEAENAMTEDGPDEVMAADESHADWIEPEASSDDGSSAAAEEDDTAASESEKSTGEQVKGGLKRMLIGLLLPAVERRVRKAVGEDDRPQAVAETEPEYEYEP